MPSLAEKIEALSDDARQEAERYVDYLRHIKDPIHHDLADLNNNEIRHLEQEVADYRERYPKES